MCLTLSVDQQMEIKKCEFDELKQNVLVFTYCKFENYCELFINANNATWFVLCNNKNLHSDI